MLRPFLLLRLAFFTSFLPFTLSAAPMPVQVAEGRSGIVAAGHPDATRAGLEVLQAGGNAVDAALAVSFALGVTEPYGSGLGGKLVMLYRDAQSGQVHSIEALDAAASSLDETSFRSLPVSQRNVGPHSVAVPGLPAGILEAHQRWGHLPRPVILKGPITLARHGFEVTPGQVRFFRSQESKLRANPETAALYMPGGNLPRAGDKLVNEDLARTMELIATHGRDGFYQGPVAAAILATLQAGGSPLQASDFAQYTARIAPPISVRFRGVDIYSSPPPVSGSGVYLLTLAALEDERLEGRSVANPRSMDRVMRVFLEADAQGRRVLGDRENSLAQWRALLARDNLALIRRQAASPTSASLPPDSYDEAMAAETTHFVIIDVHGNIVSATQSQSNHFGSGLVAPGTGVVLNNSLSNFNTVRGNPNEVAPGRRPRTTISPAIFVRGNQPVAALGIPGGSRIPSAMVQVTVDYLAFNRPLEDAIADPRFHPVTRRGGSSDNRFETERETNHTLQSALVSRHGWQTNSENNVEAFGGFNALEITPSGVKRGFADQRRSNSAMSY